MFATGQTMAATISAMVTPTVLAWARKEAALSLSRSQRVAGQVGEAAGVEQGEHKPTMRQAQNLAKIYHRPLGVFFLPQPPAIPPLAANTAVCPV